MGKQLVDQLAQRYFQELMNGPSEVYKAELWRKRAYELAEEVDRLVAERLKLDRRIHNQRVALRQTWEIVEMRRKWLGGDTARKMYASLWKRYQTLKSAAG